MTPPVLIGNAVETYAVCRKGRRGESGQSRAEQKPDARQEEYDRFSRSYLQELKQEHPSITGDRSPADIITRRECFILAAAVQNAAGGHDGRPRRDRPGYSLFKLAAPKCGAYPRLFRRRRSCGLCRAGSLLRVGGSVFIREIEARSRLALSSPTRCQFCRSHASWPGESRIPR